MPPISSNGSSLKVQTVVGDQILKDEAYSRIHYSQNQQRETKRPAGSHPLDMKAFGRSHPEPIVDEALEAVVQKGSSRPKHYTPKPY